MTLTKDLNNGCYRLTYELDTDTLTINGCEILYAVNNGDKVLIYTAYRIYQLVMCNYWYHMLNDEPSFDRLYWHCDKVAAAC